MTGVMQEERDMSQFFVEIHPVLGPEIMLAKKEPVIGGDNQCCIFPQILIVKDIKDPPSK